MNGAPDTCSSIRNRGVVLFISIMNVIPSAAGESAAAPAGKRTIGTLQESSLRSESWLDAQVMSSSASLMATTVLCTFAISVPVEPPTSTILEPAETAATQRLAAISGFWSAGSIRMAWRAPPEVSATCLKVGPASRTMALRGDWVSKCFRDIGSHRMVAASARPRDIASKRAVRGSAPLHSMSCNHFLPSYWLASSPCHQISTKPSDLLPS